MTEPTPTDPARDDAPKRAPDPDLADLGLSARDWTALAKLAEAFSQFEPLAKRVGVGPKTAEHFVTLGLAESGPSPPAFQARGMPLGYRLTDRGRRALDQERLLRTGRRTTAWLGGE